MGVLSDLFRDVGGQFSQGAAQRMLMDVKQQEALKQKKAELEMEQPYKMAQIAAAHAKQVDPLTTLLFGGGASTPAVPAGPELRGNANDIAPGQDPSGVWNPGKPADPFGKVRDMLGPRDSFKAGPLTIKPNAADARDAVGETSRRAREAEGIAASEGLTPGTLAHFMRVSELMGTYLGGRGYLQSQGTTVGANAGPARDAKVDTAGATTQRKIDVENAPPNAAAKAATATTIERAKENVPIEPIPMPGNPGTMTTRATAKAAAVNAGQGIEAGQKKEISDLQTAKDLGLRIKELSADFTKPWTGPFQSPYSALQERLGGSVPGINPLDPQQILLRRHINDIQDILLRARSGAQINEQEFQRLSGLVPKTNLPPETNRARLQGFMEYLDIVMKNKLAVQGMTQGNVNAPAPITPAPPTPQRVLRFDRMGNPVRQ